MLAEWSAACASDDPVLVVPWSSAESSGYSGADCRFIDLRQNPYDLDLIPEAEQHPALLHALRALNAGRSPFFTAKCDVWALDEDERAALRLELDLPEHETSHGMASYIDLIARDRTTFASFHHMELLLERLCRRAESLPHPLAQLDCVLRPALLDLTGPQEGFAFSLYVKALGHDEEAAHTQWAEALTAVCALLRSRELA
ncbi:MAG: hypothetical protein KGK08_08545 [Acidobacteriota bacterium]|nr:hypothetical protein [Acidobacteriota bacterium]